tara:strand:- start:210 stop:464 length:255 start_codon:yes stop_codon:yes gene_type:complete
MVIDTKIYKNRHISAYAQSKIKKLEKEVLRLTMQNSEMTDRLIKTGDEAWLKSEGILTPTNFSQMEIDFEVIKNTENGDFEIKR